MDLSLKAYFQCTRKYLLKKVCKNIFLMVMVDWYALDISLTISSSMPIAIADVIHVVNVVYCFLCKKLSNILAFYTLGLHIIFCIISDYSMET